MTDRQASERMHDEVGLSGFRAHASAIGVIELIRELRRAGTLDDAAVGRIRDSILGELALSRPPHDSEDAFRDRLRSRLDRLMQAD